jgi:hypothetical protein
MDTDYYGLIGYLCLFLFNIVKINNNITEVLPIIFIIIATGIISLYYIRVIYFSLNEKNNKSQLLLRISYHLFFILFFLHTMFITKSYYYFYLIGLFAHVILLYNVIIKSKSVIGIISLILFFIFASFNSFNNIKSNWLQFIGHLVLIIFFSKQLNPNLLKHNNKID